MEKNKILSWPEIEARIQKAIEKPYDELTPRIIPKQAALFRAMISLCELHTGQLPSRVNNSANSTLVAYYFLDNFPNYGLLEVWQGDDNPEEGLETVIAWELRAWEPPKKIVLKNGDSTPKN